MAGRSRANEARWRAFFALLVLMPLVTVARAQTTPGVSAMLERARASIVRVVALHPVRAAFEEGAPPSRPRAHVASGVVMDREGHVLTTATGLAGCIEIRVRTAAGKELTANLLGIDPTTDLALLTIPAGEAPRPARAPAAPMRPGASVFSLAQSYGQNVAEAPGRISWRYDEPLRSLLQMTTPIRPGNSGGAVVDAQGRLVGVLIGGLEELPDSDSLMRVAKSRGSSFAVPSDDLLPLMNDLVRYGGVPRGFLGVSIQQGLVDD